MTTTTLGYDQLPQLLASMEGDEKHDLAAASTLAPIWVVYDRVLRIDPARPDDHGRDRFYLSKGHGPQAYFAVLAAKGFFPAAWLATYGRYDPGLGHHPDRTLVPGVEISSGSLGHGLALAVGTALGLRSQGRHGPRVVCLMGDGELDEGSNHEAIALAGRFGLGRLTAVVVDNRSSTWGWPGGIERRFADEGWATARSSSALDELEAALSVTDPDGRPGVVVVDATARGSRP